MAMAGAVLATLAAGSVVDWAWRKWQRADVESRRRDAEMLLRARGMEVYVYLPSMGADSGPLRDALTLFDHTDRVVLNAYGGLVGRVLPKTAPLGTRGLRLVVDNTTTLS